MYIRQNILWNNVALQAHCYQEAKSCRKYYRLSQIWDSEHLNVYMKLIECGNSYVSSHQCMRWTELAYMLFQFSVQHNCQASLSNGCTISRTLFWKQPKITVLSPGNPASCYKTPAPCRLLLIPSLHAAHSTQLTAHKLWHTKTDQHPSLPLVSKGIYKDKWYYVKFHLMTNL